MTVKTELITPAAVTAAAEAITKAATEKGMPFLSAHAIDFATVALHAASRHLPGREEYSLVAIERGRDAGRSIERRRILRELHDHLTDLPAVGGRVAVLTPDTIRSIVGDVGDA